VKNSLGVDISGPETELMAVHDALRRVVGERLSELQPYQARNALKALACLWQIANGLDMEPAHLYHVGA
jgi:hypothetical protein